VGMGPWNKFEHTVTHTRRTGVNLMDNKFIIDNDNFCLSGLSAFKFESDYEIVQVLINYILFVKVTRLVMHSSVYVTY